ncbi:MAG: bile acid:sodium symporter family protein [Saprospiraceae bacterium]|nr:bile acid:sodium symporter family protein [Saprospiraceae bacterium]
MTYIDLLISGILAFIMVSVGLSLTERDFALTFKRPRAYFTGVFAQMVLLPMLAFGVANVSGLPPEFQVGILILAACPGGMTSSFLSYLLGANAALSVSLVTTNSFIALVSVPLIVNGSLLWFMGQDTHLVLPFWDTVWQIFSITILPVVAGVLLRRKLPEFSRRVENPLKWITLALLAALFAIKFFAGEDQGGSGITVAEILKLLPYSFAVNVLGLTVGYLAARSQGLSVKNRITIGIEVGIQNTNLAFLIAGTLIGNEAMLKPALVYAMFSFFTALVYGLVQKPDALGQFTGRQNRAELGSKG